MKKPIISLIIMVVGVALVTGLAYVSGLAAFMESGIEAGINQAPDEALAILSGAVEVANPDPDDMECAGVAYSTEGIPMKVVKFIGDEHCYPAMQLPELSTSTKCEYAFYEGNLYSLVETSLEDQGDHCGTVTLADVRKEGTIFVERRAIENFKEFLAKKHPPEEVVEVVAGALEE